MSNNDDDETLSKSNFGIDQIQQCDLFSGLGESNSPDVCGDGDRPTVEPAAEVIETAAAELIDDVSLGHTEQATERTVPSATATGLIDDVGAEPAVECVVSSGTDGERLEPELVPEEEGVAGVVTAGMDEGQVERFSEEAVPVIEEKAEVVVGEEGQFSDLQMEANIDELIEKREETEVQCHEMENGEEMEEVGGKDDDLADTLVGDSGIWNGEEVEEVGGNDSAVAETLGEETEFVGEDRVDSMEGGNAENPVMSERGNIDPLYNEGIPSCVVEQQMEVITEVIEMIPARVVEQVGVMTEVNEAVVNASEPEEIVNQNDGIGDASADVKFEQDVDKKFIAKGDLLSGANVKDENMNVDARENPCLDEPFRVAEEDVVKFEHAEDKDFIAEGALLSGDDVKDENMNVDAMGNPPLDEPLGVAEEDVVKFEHAEDRDFITEGALLSGDNVKDDNMNMDAMGNSPLDEPLRVAEEEVQVAIEQEHRSGDVKMEMDGCEESEIVKNDVEEESEIVRNDVEEETQLEGEVETETDNQVMVHKGLVEAGKMETDETRSDLDEPAGEMDGTPDALHDEEDEAMFAEEETGNQDTEVDTETDVPESGKSSIGKRKRGKLSKSPSKPTARSSSRKAVGEDVCFICFDGGDLFLCDRRGCPKAYHPSCVNRDEAFFRAKGRWNCGWHLCSICEKTARYMCYTCTFSLCKGCIKDSVILCVRGNKGFCESCMKIVHLVENNDQGNKELQTQIDFDDRSSWEYLFKDYYTELKSKLALSYDEIVEAKNPCKVADASSGPRKQQSSAAQVEADDAESGSDDSVEKSESSRPKKRKLRKQTKSLTRKGETGNKDVGTRNRATPPDKFDWASKELLEFVSHMKDGETSVISQFEVQGLLLEYIKSNKLRDPRRKSQIICDARLENLFGKPRVGHFEMLKLLESHFLTRDEQNDDGQGSVVDTENNQLDTDDNGELSKGKKRKPRRKSDLVRQSNLDDYAAIDMHNISLIYLRRKLMEDILEDTETFNEKAAGTFVRIRIFGSNQKQDLYRLVQVLGTTKAPEPYKVGKKTTDTMIEILNLDKTESVSIDSISNQEFTEEECKRLRQSFKCGLLARLTVGEILDKAMEIQIARVNDWLESETLRLSHLRDRASDLGRRKELRECVEKLQLLKTPEERRRRLEEVPKVHADPKMDPNYESDENGSEDEDSRRDAFMRSKGISRRGRGPISPGSDPSQKESWSSGTKVQNKNWEASRNLSSNNFSTGTTNVGEAVNESSWSLGDKGTQESINMANLNSASNSNPVESAVRATPRSESFAAVATVQSPIQSGVAETAVKINETEKMWHYRDPSGKEQGPFSMVQLRKWSNTGYFPNDLKIWRSTGTESNSMLLADALAGKFPKESHASLDGERQHIDQTPMAAKLSNEVWRGNEMMNLPSPTPRQRINPGPVRNEENSVLPSPTVVLPASVLNSVVQSGAPYSPTPKSQQMNTVGATDSLQHQPTIAESHPSQIHGQTGISQNLQAESQGWSGMVQSAEPHGGYALAPNVQQDPSGTAFSNSTNAALPQSDFWRPPTQGSQINVLPPTPTTPNASSWGMRPPENNSSPGLVPANSNGAWGSVQSNPNMGWGSWGPAIQTPNSGNTSAAWVPPGGPVGANMNPGWGPAPQGWGPAPVQGPGWAAPSGNPGAPPPVPGPVSGNGWGPNSGAPPVQGSNSNQGWQGNQGPWVGEQNHDGHQGGGPWNRSGGGRPRGGNFRKGDVACPYNQNGRCRKGSRCDYMHV